MQRYSLFSNLKKAGIFKIKGPSNFREKIEEKLEVVDICTNPFEKNLPLTRTYSALILEIEMSRGQWSGT